MKGEAPYHVEFRWVYGAPFPVGLGPDARRAMIRQRLQEILDRTMPPPGSEAVDAGQPNHTRQRSDWDIEAWHGTDG